MLEFEQNELVLGMNPCRRISLPIHSKQIDEAFKVNDVAGNCIEGNPGDYLMESIDGKKYICDQEIYNKTYEDIEL